MFSKPEGASPGSVADALTEWCAICQECSAIFTQDEIAREADSDAWGHPCRARNFRKPTPCESYREVWIKTAEHVHNGARCVTDHDGVHKVFLRALASKAQPTQPEIASLTAQVAALTRERERERKVCIKAMCMRCREGGDGGPKKRDGVRGWWHISFGRNANWTECYASNLHDLPALSAGGAGAGEATKENG